MSASTDETSAGRGPPAKPAALGFVYVVMLLNVTSMGITIPVFPELLRQLSGGGNAEAAQIAGLFSAAWALMQLIFAPLFGAISDRYGRRPVLLISMFGLAIDFVIMALAPNLFWLFIGRVVAGVTSASSSAAGAYVADVSTPDTRARNCGRFMAAANAGIVLGPAIGGYLGEIDPRLPFWVAAGLSFANGLYGLFMVPESLSQDRRAPFSWRNAHVFGALSMLTRSKGLLGLATVLFLAQLAMMSFGSVFQFYTSHMWQWTSKDLGFFLMVYGIGSVIVQSFLAGASARMLGERRSVLIGMTLSFFAFLIQGLLTSESWFWFGCAFAVLSGISNPSVQSMLTGRVGVDEQGRLQGALSLYIGLTGLFGPPIFAGIFAWSIGPGASLGMPGLSILFGAGLMAAAVAFAWVFARSEPPGDEAATSATGTQSTR